MTADSSGWVLYCDPTLRETAESYAAATGRLATAEPSSLDGFPGRVDVMLALLSHLTPERVSWMNDMARRTGCLPGLITGHSAADVEEHSAAVLEQRGPCEANLSRCDIVANIPVGCGRTPERVIVGAKASIEQVRRELGRGHDLLYLQGHSDSIDSQLPASGVLCSLKGLLPLAPDATSRQAACLCSQRCHRLKIPLSHIAQDARAVAVADIRTRFLVMDSCYVVPMESEHAEVSSRWTLFSELLRHKHVRCGLFGVELRNRGGGRLSEVLKALQAGEEAGTAIGSFLARQQSRRFDLCFLLLGDPWHRLRTPYERTCTSVPPQSEVEPPKIGSAFVPWMLQQISPPPADPVAPAQWLQAMEQGLGGGVNLPNAWIRFAEMSSGSATCITCGCVARMREFRFPELEHSRRLTRCWHCGTCVDQPVSDDLRVDWGPGHRVVRIRRTGGLAHGTLTVWAKAKTEAESSTTYPLEASAGPADIFAPVGDDLVGPVSVMILYVADGNYGSFLLERHFGNSSAR